MGSEVNSKIAQADSKSDLGPARKLAALCLSQNVKLNFVPLHVMSSYSKYSALFLLNMRNTYCSSGINVTDYDMSPSAYEVCKPESNVPL